MSEGQSGSFIKLKLIRLGIKTILTIRLRITMRLNGINFRHISYFKTDLRPELKRKLMKTSKIG